MVTNTSAYSLPAITFNLNTRFDMDTGDLLNNLTRRMQVNQPLVNPHLISIPSLRTLTVGGLPGGDFKDLGGQSDGPLDFEILVLGSCDQIRADYQLATAHEESMSCLGTQKTRRRGFYRDDTFFDILNVTGSQGDTNAVDFDGSLGLFVFFSSFSD